MSHARRNELVAEYRRLMADGVHLVRPTDSLHFFYFFVFAPRDEMLTPMQILLHLLAVRALGPEAACVELVHAMCAEGCLELRLPQLLHALSSRTITDMCDHMYRHQYGTYVNTRCMKELWVREEVADPLPQICGYLCVSGEGAAHDVPLLCARGVTAVLRVSEECAPDEVLHMYRVAAIEYNHISADFTTAAGLELACTRVHAEITRVEEHGGVVLVHDLRGTSRCIAVVAHHLGMVHHEPYATVMATRILPLHPDAAPAQELAAQLAVNAYA